MKGKELKRQINSSSRFHRFMVHYFGSLYTVLFVFNIVLFSVASGLMMERIVMKTPEDTDPCKRNQ